MARRVDGRLTGASETQDGRPSICIRSLKRMTIIYSARNCKFERSILPAVAQFLQSVPLCNSRVCLFFSFRGSIDADGSGVEHLEDIADGAGFLRTFCTTSILRSTLARFALRIRLLRYTHISMDSVRTSGRLLKVLACSRLSYRKFSLQIRLFERIGRSSRDSVLTSGRFTM